MSTRYEWYKQKHICPRCGQAEGAKGRVCCLNCLDKEAILTMKYRMTHDTKEKNRIFCKERYNRAKEAGICVKCLKRKATEGHVICDFCRGRGRK